MFAIYVKDKCLGYFVKPHYIKPYIDPQTDTKRYVEADNYEEAVAVTVHGTIYSLPFKEPIEGHETEAVIVEKQDGEYIFNNKTNIDQTENDLKETKACVEDALCEVDIDIENRIAMLEDVICELDAMMN